MKRTLVLPATVAAAALTAVALPGADTLAAWRRPPPAEVERIYTPLGRQGLQGAGANVVIGFVLVDPLRRLTDVEVQFGIDWDGDGAVSDDEYRRATEDRNDSRNTRRNRKPQKYTTSSDLGAVHAFVWRSTADLGPVRIVAGSEPVWTVEGRTVPDPFDSSRPLMGPDSPGVKVRIRAIGPRRRAGAWTTSEGFSVVNDVAPVARFDDVSVVAGDPAKVVIDWTAADADSEDLNGNGLLDVDLGEDVNLNGVLDRAPIAVAFDWHRLAPGEDPASMTDADLAALRWEACVRAEGEGDPSTGLATAPPAVGLPYTFVWDTYDVARPGERFLLRAVPFDEHRSHGAAAYWRTPVVPVP